MLNLKSLVSLIGLFGLSTTLLPSTITSPFVDACYCAIGYQSGYTPPNPPSGGWTSAPSWVSPAVLPLQSGQSAQYNTFLNNYPLSQSGLIWNTLDTVNNKYKIDSQMSTVAISSLGNDAYSTIINQNMTSKPNFYTNTFSLTGVLTGCVVPYNQPSFVTSIQFVPYAYYDTSSYQQPSSTHQDNAFVFVKQAGTNTPVQNITVLNNNAVVGHDSFWTQQFGLTVGTNYIWLNVGNVDLSGSSTGCPFMYKWTVTCTQAPAPTGVHGDPQFTGFLGQDYQVHGLSGTVYNIISTPDLHYNALFQTLDSGKCRKGTLCFSHPGNYFKTVSLQMKDNNGINQIFIIDSGAVDVGLSITWNDGQNIINIAEPIEVGKYKLNWINKFELVLESDEFNMSIQNSDQFINQDVSIGTELMGKIAQHKKAVRSEGADVEELEKNLPHGILGQTWQYKTYKNRWKYIQGQLFDYIVDDLLSTEFHYTRYDSGKLPEL